MKTLYYDCFSGISGDMNLAAMIELGVPIEFLIKELEKLPVTGWEIKTKKDHKNGIYGTRVDVISTEKFEKGHHHVHRGLADITSLISESELHEEVKQLSLKIFEKVAIAEAKVHNTSVNKIHFHEVGAMDSIIDIVGAAICFHYLKPDKVMSSTIELGGGFVKCAHGTIPVPAPATTEILKGIPVHTGRVNYETTTPTGAAILASLVDEFSDNLEFNITRTAYGIGHRDMEIPNVLRVYMLETTINNIEETSKIAECNIDDMSPESYDFVMDKLFNAGAEDVYITPILMKKSRPAVKLSVLYKLEIEGDILDIVFRNTTTLGIRKYEVNKTVLQRREDIIATQWGDVRIKKSYYKNQLLHAKPEYEDCKKIALEHNISIFEIQKQIQKIVDV